MIKSLEIKRLWISIQSTTGEGIFCSLLSQKGLYGTVSNSLAHNKVIFSQISPHTNFQILQKHWIPWEKNPYKWIENECRLQQVKKQMCIQTQGKLPHEDKNQAWKWFYAKSCTFKTDAGNQCHQIKFKHRPWHQTSKKKRQQNSNVEKTSNFCSWGPSDHQIRLSYSHADASQRRRTAHSSRFTILL